MLIHLNGRKARRGSLQHIRCQAGSRSQLKDMRPKIDARKSPLHPLPDNFSPTAGTAQPVMQTVHAFPLSFNLREFSLMVSQSAHFRYDDKICRKSGKRPLPSARFSIASGIAAPKSYPSRTTTPPDTWSRCTFTIAINSSMPLAG